MTFGNSILTGDEAFNRMARMVASRMACRVCGSQGRMRTSRSISELSTGVRVAEAAKASATDCARPGSP